MNAATAPGYGIIRIPRLRWPIVFFTLVGVLSSTILLKIAGVQYLEIVYAFQVLLLFTGFVRSGYRTSWYRILLWLLVSYAIVAAVAMALAFASLRFEFYFPDDYGPLSGPVWITITRVIELGLDVFGMLYLADEFRKHPAMLRFTMRIYFWTGMLSAVYSLVSYALLPFGVHLSGVYADIHRLRGFFNEGGPYGLYVVSVALVGVALYQLDWERRRWLLLAAPVLAVTFAGSYSKAASGATLALLVLNGLLARSIFKRIFILVCIFALLTAAAQFFSLTYLIQTYSNIGQSYERASHFHSNDPNFVAGRIAGAYIVPRMIAAHPYSGIGWGNYPALRNVPEYRGASTWVGYADNPSLGIFGLAADLGIPLVLFLILTLFTPFLSLRRAKVPPFLWNLALLQPLAHLSGAQLNVTYAWTATAFALGLGFNWDRTYHAQRELSV